MDVRHFNTSKVAKRQYNVDAFGIAYKSGCGMTMNVSSLGFTRNVDKVTCERCLESRAYRAAVLLPAVTDPCKCGLDMFEHWPFVDRDPERCKAFRAAEMEAK